MKLKDGIKEHEVGNQNCPACDAFEELGQTFNAPTACLDPNCKGLRHVETVGDLDKGGTAHLHECDVCRK